MALPVELLINKGGNEMTIRNHFIDRRQLQFFALGLLLLARDSSGAGGMPDRKFRAGPPVHEFLYGRAM